MNKKIFSIAAFSFLFFATARAEMQILDEDFSNENLENAEFLDDENLNLDAEILDDENFAEKYLNFGATPISDLSATAGDGTITLNFSPPTSARRIILQVARETSRGEKIFRHTYSDEILDEFSTKIVRKALKNGKNYTFRLLVIGGENAGYSNEASATPTFSANYPNLGIENLGQSSNCARYGVSWNGEKYNMCYKLRENFFQPPRVATNNSIFKKKSAGKEIFHSSAEMSLAQKFLRISETFSRGEKIYDLQ